jgi:poly(3-hydroxybutyrate) depolymerase
VSLPPDYDPAHPYPLFFGFHGKTRTHEQCRDVDCRGLEALFGKNQVIVYLQSLDAGWWTPESGHTKELSFFDAVFDQVKRDYCVDEARVVLTGTSSGAFFANALACHAPERFLGVVPVGGGPAGEDCSGAVAALVIHGVDDRHVAFSEGEAMRDAYLARNGCSQDSKPALAQAHSEVRAARDRGEANHRCVDYEDCREGFPVRWCEHGEGGWDDSTHAWPTFGGAMLADFLASRLSEPRVQIEAPAATAELGKVRIEQRLSARVHSIAVGKPPRVAILGDSAFLFDGTWKDFAFFARFCASAVSAQSYHFLAFSRFLPPFTIDIEPIS